MRLFTKSPLSPSRNDEIATKGTRHTKAVKTPRSKTSKKTIPNEQKITPKPTSSTAGISSIDDDHNPYPLQRVPTAHEYQSDDSDDELERTPSRYELRMEAMDDVAMDDAVNDRYGHIARRIMLADSDSVDAMWRSFSYEDENINGVANVKQRVDPLSFERDDCDWDDGEYYTEDPYYEENSLTEIRDAPPRHTARRMNSMVDEVDDEEEFEEDDLALVPRSHAEEFSGGSSLSSILADELDSKRMKMLAEANANLQVNLLDGSPEISDHDDNSKLQDVKTTGMLTIEIPPEPTEEEYPEDSTSTPRDDAKDLPPTSPTGSKGNSTLERDEVVNEVIKLNEKRKKARSPRFLRPLTPGRAVASVGESSSEKTGRSPRFLRPLTPGRGRVSKGEDLSAATGPTSPLGIGGFFKRGQGKNSRSRPSKIISLDVANVAVPQREERDPAPSIGQDDDEDDDPKDSELTTESSDQIDGLDDFEDSNNSREEDPALVKASSPPPGILRTSTYVDEDAAEAAERAKEDKVAEDSLTTAHAEEGETGVVPARCRAAAPPEDSGIFGLVSRLMGLNDDESPDTTTAKPLAVGEIRLDNPNSEQEADDCDNWCHGSRKRLEDQPQPIQKEQANVERHIPLEKKSPLASPAPLYTDDIFEDRSVPGEVVQKAGGLEREYLTEIEAKQEPVVVACLRDNYCEEVADCLMCGVKRVDNVGCQQTYGFLDEAIKAENPKRGVIDLGSDKLDAGSLTLDRNKQSSDRRSKNRPNDFEEEYDVPIRTIEFAVGDDGDTYSESYSTLGGRRKTALRVDTRLEEEMRHMQDELEGKKKKSLFGRMKRRGRN